MKNKNKKKSVHDELKRLVKLKMVMDRLHHLKESHNLHEKIIKKLEDLPYEKE